MRRRALLSATTALALSCRREARAPLVVFAAASLREVTTAIAERWTARSGLPVRETFDATPRLARLVLAGAACDVFLSADEAWMDELAAHDAIAGETRRDVAANELVAIVPAASTAPLTSARDLTRQKRLALAGENVPAGRYARAALRSTGVWSEVEPHVVSGDSVRVALEWVARGEADAGIVYASDVRAEPRVKAAFTFAKETHPPIRYAAAVLRAAAHPREAASFLDAFGDEAGLRTLAEAGFSAAP